METFTESKPKKKYQRKPYESSSRTRRRGEEYYPPDALKQQLNDYALEMGVYKSELAVRLLRSFFAARKRLDGCDPAVIELLP